MVALTCFGIMKKHDNPPADTWIMLTLVYGYGFIWFLIFYFAGWYKLRISRKLFKMISTLNIFDNNDYFVGYLEKESRIFYTQECLCGKIDGYPVIISFDLATGKGQTSTLDFEVITLKFNRAYTERMSVTLNWLRGYEPIRDVKKEVDNFIEDLKSKSSVIGSFEAIIADKRLSPAEYSHDVEI
jgi:hypothetical protein